MKVNLPTHSFSFFKLISGATFLSFALFSSAVVTYSLLAILAVGRAHSLGAWFAMWRAGKITWIYACWVLFFVLTVTYWGLYVAPPITLAYVMYTLFSFHFFFDEFDLQEEKRTAGNLLSGLCPLALMYLFLAKSYFVLLVPFILFVILTVSFWALETIYLRELNWFFIHTKILTVFILISIYLEMKASSVLIIFLMLHYFFWFIYPTYKIHRYRPEERNGFILVLLLIIGVSIAFAATKAALGPEVVSLSLKVFQIGTIVHILSTAPFGYIFGLPKPKVYA